jgi:hypothetical protein
MCLELRARDPVDEPSVGPIARQTGDIEFEVAMATTAMLYIPLRKLEQHRRGV